MRSLPTRTIVLGCVTERVSRELKSTSYWYSQLRAIGSRGGKIEEEFNCLLSGSLFTSIPMDGKWIAAVLHYTRLWNT
jgi:hypothetical protein